MSKIARIFKPLNSNLLSSHPQFNRFSQKYFSTSNPPYKTTTLYTAYYSSNSSGNEDSPVGDDDGTIYNNRRVHKALAISSTKTGNKKIHESYYAESSYSYTNLELTPVIEQGNSEISAVEIMQLLKCGDTKKLMELNNLGKLAKITLIFKSIVL
ncbi:MAG: hypothetical protein HRU35_07815 [Rickettsiaceae bacterium]|nr:hypothetical protein [Rickettsiaceae bacterium]